MKLKVKKPAAELVAGRHDGVISKVEFRMEPFQYVDVYCKFDDADFEVKKGYPATVSATSGLGQLLQEAIGTKLTPDDDVDPMELLEGKKCYAMTDIEPSNDGSINFARILTLHIKK